MAEIEHTFENVASADNFVGDSLQKTRVAKNMSVDEVARQLRLSTHQIIALEQDDFAKLPDAMITRGFIRNYAKLLDIDAVPLLQLFKAKMPDVGLATLSLKSEHIVIQGYRKKSYAAYLQLSVVLLLGLAVWWLYMNRDMLGVTNTDNQTLSEQSVDNATLTPETAEPLPAQALPAAERLAEASNLDSAAAAATVPSMQSAEVNLAQPTVDQPAQPAISTTGAAIVEPTQLPISQDASSVIASLKASEETWVQVLNMGGSVIYERTIAAGTSDNFAFKPPVKMVVGNASGTQLVITTSQLI